eukprot:3187938-Lingulodinium_polyedra.AAC.1
MAREIETAAAQRAGNDARILKNDDARLALRKTAEQRERGVTDARGCGSAFYRAAWRGAASSNAGLTRGL